MRDYEKYLIQESQGIFYFRSPLIINIQLFIELFHTCNYNCSYCYQPNKKFYIYDKICKCVSDEYIIKKEIRSK